MSIIQNGKTINISMKTFNIFVTRVMVDMYDFGDHFMILAAHYDSINHV